MKIEKIVEKFYEGLAEHKIYARKCLECGAIEYPPDMPATPAGIMRQNGLNCQEKENFTVSFSRHH